MEVVFMRGVDPDTTAGIRNTEKVSRNGGIISCVAVRCEKIKFSIRFTEVHCFFINGKNKIGS